MNKQITILSTIALILLLPSCGGYQLWNRERVIEKAERTYSEITYRYKREMSLLKRETNKAELKKQLKDEVLVKYDHPSEPFPFIAYKTNLVESINRLADQQHTLIRYAYLSELRHDIGRAIDNLETINRYISTDSDYKEERIRFDERRVEAENNAAIAGLAGAAIGAVAAVACTPRETVVVHEPVVAYVPYYEPWPVTDVVEVEHVYEYY